MGWKRKIENIGMICLVILLIAWLFEAVAGL